MGAAGVEAGRGGTTGAADFFGATIGVTTTPEAVVATYLGAGADGAVCVFANPGLGKPDVARGEADARPGAGAGAGFAAAGAGLAAGLGAGFAEGAVCGLAKPALGNPVLIRAVPGPAGFTAGLGAGAGAGAGAGLVAAGVCAGADAGFSAARIAAREGTNGFAVRARKSRPHFQQKFASSDAIVPH